MIDLSDSNIQVTISDKYQNFFQFMFAFWFAGALNNYGDFSHPQISSCFSAYFCVPNVDQNGGHGICYGMPFMVEL